LRRDTLDFKRFPFADTRSSTQKPADALEAPADALPVHLFEYRQVAPKLEAEPMGVGLWERRKGGGGRAPLGYIRLTVNARSHALMSRYQHPATENACWRY
jgi:hypothetical protein